MDLPSDLQKPFFSYGIFRPGEIAFQIISDYVDINRIEKRTITGQLKLRDGLLIFDQQGNESVQGYLLFFKAGMELLAYEKIVGLEPDKYYMWNESSSNFRYEFNILFGKSSNKGVDEDRGVNDPILWDNLFDSIWNDPFIKNGFNLLDVYVKRKMPIKTIYKEFKWDEESCFNDYLSYQMFYIFLCSILERIMFLNGGFGAKPSEQLRLFSQDRTLNKVFKLLVKSQDFPQFKESFQRKIFRSDDPSVSTKWNYVPENVVDIKEALFYYYQLRSNITHRGKSGIAKLAALERSFEELSFILKTFWTEKERESIAIKKEIEFLIIKRNENK